MKARPCYSITSCFIHQIAWIKHPSPSVQKTHQNRFETFNSRISIVREFFFSFTGFFKTPIWWTLAGFSWEINRLYLTYEMIDARFKTISGLKKIRGCWWTRIRRVRLSYHNPQTCQFHFPPVITPNLNQQTSRIALMSHT